MRCGGFAPGACFVRTLVLFFAELGEGFYSRRFVVDFDASVVVLPGTLKFLFLAIVPVFTAIALEAFQARHYKEMTSSLTL